MPKVQLSNKAVVLDGIMDVLEHVGPDDHEYRLREDFPCCLTLMGQIYGAQSERDTVNLIRALNTVLMWALPSTRW